MAKRLDLKGAEFLGGDPSEHVVGKKEEQPARVHAPQPPKPTRTAKVILADVRLRMQELEPLVKEFPALEEADKALRGL